MAAALECWSSRTSTDTDDMVEQVLMRTNDRSEGSPPPATSSSSGAGVSNKDSSSSSSSVMQKRLQKLSRNVSEAIASLKNSLNLDSARDLQRPPPKADSCRKVVWGSVVRSLTQLYPGSQLPEKLVSNIRKHYDSLPLSYAQAGFDMKEVSLHIKLIEQASSGCDSPPMVIQEVSSAAADVVRGGGDGPLFKVTFACNSLISWPSMSASLETASICCKKMQIFEKKGFTLGVVLLFFIQPDQERVFKTRIENALKLAMIKRPSSTIVKLPFGLCGCQEEMSVNGRESSKDEWQADEQDIIDEQQNYFYYRDNNGFDSSTCSYYHHQKMLNIQLPMPLPNSSFVASVDEWQTVVQSGEIGKWLLNSDHLEFLDQIGQNSFKGIYKGRKVGIEKLKGCGKGNSYEFQVRRDLLQLMTCGHKSILQFVGVCIDESHGLCALTKLMEGGSVQDLMIKNNKQLQIKDIVRICIDVVEGIKFMNDHGVAYRDLNTQRILLDRYGNACLGDMGIVAACKTTAGEALEYETDGYRWLAPEIIAGDPESVKETGMSNVYSLGMVMWEMVTGEAAYSAYSPVQAAVGISACGLRPDIPKDCPNFLTTLMSNCWNNSPSNRPHFSHILSSLLLHQHY